MQEDDGNYETVALRSVRLALENDESWLRLVDTTPDGVRLLARVEDGEITDWIVQDPFGNPLTATVTQTAKIAGKVCNICVKVAGQTQCWDVPCDKITILPPKATKRIREEEDDVGEHLEISDARQALNDLKLSEGINEFFTSPSGIRFAARVEQDIIVEWLAYDVSGKQLPTTVYQKKKKPKPGKPAGEPIKCFVCTNGNCTEIPCDRIVVAK